MSGTAVSVCAAPDVEESYASGSLEDTHQATAHLELSQGILCIWMFANIAPPLKHAQDDITITTKFGGANADHKTEIGAVDFLADRACEKLVLQYNCKVSESGQHFVWKLDLTKY